MKRVFSWIAGSLIVCLSRMFIYLFRYAISKRSFRSLLKYVPSSVLMIGDKFTARSFDQSLLSQPKKGSVALVAESGALKIIMLNLMAKEGLGLSRLISYDDSPIWDEVRCLKEIAQDRETDVIMLCIESMKRGREFIEVAKKISMLKPIVVFKSGKSRVGARAVLSHTGSLAGSDEVCNAAFRQSLVLRAQTIEEMLDFAKALSYQPLAKGSKAAIVTNAGGAGIVSADTCVTMRLEVPELPRSIKEYFEKKLPLFSGFTNPLDLKASATAEIYADALDCLLRFDGVDVLILMVYPTPALEMERFVDVVFTLWKKYRKPMVVSATGSDRFIAYLRRLEEFGIPVYLLPERAVAAAAALVYYGRVQEQIAQVDAT